MSKYVSNLLTQNTKITDIGGLTLYNPCHLKNFCSDCPALITGANIYIDSNWNSTNDFICTYMYNECKKLKIYTFDITTDSNFNCKDPAFIFNNCHMITEFPSALTKSNVNINGNINNCFANCSSMVVNELPSAFFNNLKNNNNGNMDYTFFNCKKIEKIEDGATLYPAIFSMISMFENCTGLNTIPTSFFNTLQQPIINITNIFKNCSSLSSKMPADKLWNNKNILWTVNGAFYGAIKISNYTEIPDSWK